MLSQIFSPFGKASRKLNTRNRKRLALRRALFSESLEDRRMLAGIEIAFIDSTVWDQDSVPAGLTAAASEVVVLDANRDGIQQMADYLEGRTEIGAVHIVSHGEIGQIGPLGNAGLFAYALADYSDRLMAIGSVLSTDGDILLWGCGVAGNNGTEFVQAVADATGADVAASDDLTGSPSLGGDWDLEYTTGPIEASNILASFDPQITLESDTISGASFISSTGGTITFELGNNTYGANDVDMWGINLTGGERITVNVEGNATLGASYLNDPYLRVFDSAGSQVAVDDDGGTGLNSSLVWDVPSSGSYYLSVSSYSNTSYNPNSAGSGSGGNDTGTVRMTWSVLDRPNFQINNVSVTEGSSATFTVSRNRSGTNASVQYSTQTNSAGPADFTTQSGTLNFSSTQTSATISVPTTSDSIDELTEQFYVNLFNSVNAGISDSQSIGTIFDNDPPALVSINNVSVTEGGVATFTLTKDRQSSFLTSVNYTTAPSSASTADYVSETGTVTFPAFSTSATLTIATVEDFLVEGTEQFLVNLSSPNGMSISDGQGVGSIINDDNAPVPSAGGPYIISEGGALSLNASASTDADGQTLAYRWDVNNDGNFNDATGVTPTLNWAQLTALGIDDGPDGPRTVRVEVTDGYNPRIATTTLTINNVAPNLSNVSVTSTIDENDTATLSGTITDPGTLDTHTLDIDWGDGSVQNIDLTAALPAGVTWNPTTGAFSVQHQYLDDGANPGGSPSFHYDVDVTVTDNSGDSTTTTAPSLSTATVPAGFPPSNFDDATSSTFGPVASASTLSFGITSGYAHSHGGSTVVSVEVHDPNSGTWTQIFSQTVTSPDLQFNGLTINFAPQTVDQVRILSNPNIGATFHGFSGTTITISGVSTATGVTVNNVDPVAATQNVSTDENNPAGTFNVLTGLTDQGTLDTHSAVVVASGTTTNGGTYTIAANGDATYDPNGAFEALGQGAIAIDTFTYTIVDDDTGTDTGTVVVTINGVNDAPVIDLDGADETGIDWENTFTEDLGAVAIADIDATVTDIDGGGGGTAISGTGDIFVVNIDGRIVKVDPVTGAQTAVNSGALIQDARGMGIDVSTGTLYVADAYPDQIVKVDINTGAETVLSSGGLLFEAWDVEADGSGNVFVSDLYGHRVIKIDSAGTQTLVSSGGLLDFAAGIDIEADGKLIVSTLSGVRKVVRVDPTTGTQTLLTSGGFLITPDDVDIAADGTIFIADRSGRVIKVDPTTGAQTLVSSGSNLNATFGVSIDANGTLFTTNFGVNSVVEVDATSGAQSVVTSGGLLTFTLGSAINSSFSSDLITSGTITITNLLDTGDEYLAVSTSGTNIVAVYNPATGVMTLTGDDTVANYQTVIRSATYNNTSQDPDTTDRVIEFLVNDGIDPNAPPAFTTLTIVPVNDSPDITGTAISSSLTETDTTLTDTGSLNVVDLDLSDTVTITVDSLAVNASSTFAGTNPLTNAAMKAMMAVSPTTALAADPTTGTNFNWTFTSGASGDSAFNFLAAGETLVLEYTLKATDSSGATNATNTQVVTVTITGTNDAPIINSAAQSGTITETADSAPATDAEPADASGTITFDDVDLSDLPTASILSGASVTGGTASLTPGQAIALLDNLSLGAVAFSSATGAGSVGWTYAVPNTEIDFLAAGETVELTFTVEVNDNNGGTDMQDVVITITGTNDAAEVTVDNPNLTDGDDEQYSDSISPITFTAIDVDNNAMMTATIAYKKDGGSFLPGLPDALTVAGGLVFSDGVTPQASPATWTISGIADLAPGAYTFKITVNDGDGGMTDLETVLDVVREDAVPNYAGLLFVTTDPQHQDDLTLELRAVVQDITFFGGSDVEGGDITRDDIPTATVTFVITNLDGPGSWTILNVPVQPLATDPLTGVAVTTLNITGLLSNTSVGTTLSVEMFVDGYYTGSDETLVTVAKPDGDFITGGGYLNEEASYGGAVTYTDGLGIVHQNEPLDVADSSKMNFGFQLKYNQKLTNLQGNFTSILRMEDGSKWQIKTNATNSLQIAPHPTVEGAYLATFQAKANLKNLTLGGSIGGLTIIVKMVDYGEPGSQSTDPTPDTISWTLWDGPTLIYSSNWTGSAAFEQDLSGGNVQIHTNKLNAAGATAAAKQSSGQALDDRSLQATVQHANDMWSDSGLSPDQLSLLYSIDVQMFDLGGATLGVAIGDQVWIDRDAAGFGWDSGHGLETSPAGFDLLSVVMHEFGHVLGVDHSVMGATLGVGLRNVDWLHSDQVHEHAALQQGPALGSADAYFERLDDQLGVSRTTRRYDELAKGLEVGHDSSDDTLLSPTQSRIAAELAWVASHRQSRERSTSADHDKKTVEEDALDGLFAIYDDELAILDR